MTTTLLQWILLFYLSGFVTCQGQEKGLRVVHKLVGGHISLTRDDDVELMTSGAGEGKGSKKKSSDKEEKKTLAQQVADGKYALIQTELFSKPIKKPGVISYRENGEVPRDNIGNLGGLNKSDIWLSENHLLVIKGGAFPPHSSQHLETDVWPSIDDYDAPDRQVKIPAHPKVPPPFPVQLTDGGPLLLLGTNASKTLNGSLEPPVYPVFPEENYVPDSGEPSHHPDRHPTNSSAGKAPFPIPPFPGPGLDYYDPAKERPVNNGNLPFFPFVGPSDLPPLLDNVTYDEDDPSIYYPPPYSFYYRQDNSTEVPPGPLVPGIVLPPPPNFFAPLDEDKERQNGTKTLYESTTTYEPSTTSLEPTKFVETTTITPRNETYNITIPTATPAYKKPPPTASNHVTKYPTITILKAITTALPQYVKQDGRSYKARRPPQSLTRTKTVVTTTRVPLKGYYTTTHFEPIPREKPTSKQYINELVVNIPTSTKSPPAQYFFYGSGNDINTAPRLRKPIEKFNVDNVPNYYLPAKQVDIVIKEQPPHDDNLRYYYLNNNPKAPELPRRPPDSFSIHIARLKDQIHTYQSALRSNNEYYRRPIFKPIPKPVYQYSFQSVDYNPNQKNQYVPRNQQYDIEIQEAIEVTPPTPIYQTTQGDSYYYRESVTEAPKRAKAQSSRNRPKPISEYSFEATPNPIFQQLYTKHDEPYIDDVTKEYFTVFGKKLPASTTPIPPYSEREYLNSRRENGVRNTPTLEHDTVVNYLHPRPQINQHAEYITNIKYRDDTQDQHYVNYENSREKIEQERPFISYKLPGDEGTHFYFITPKLAQKRQQNTSYFYP